MPFTEDCFNCIYSGLSIDRPDLIPTFDNTTGFPNLIKKMEDSIKSGTEWIREYLEIPELTGDKQTDKIDELSNATSDLNAWFEDIFMTPFTGSGISGISLNLHIPSIPSVGPGVEFPRFNPPDIEIPTPDWFSVEGLGLAKLVEAFITLPYQIFKQAVDSLLDAKVPSIDVPTINSMLTNLMESAGIDLTGYGPDFPNISFPSWPDEIQCLAENIPSLLEF